MRIFELGVRTNQMTFVKTGDGLEHETDETVALVAHALHHGAAIDPAAIAGNPERRQRAQPVPLLRRGNQQLRRHAANPGTGGAERTAFDQCHAVSVLAHFAIGRHARRAGTDDGDFDFAQAHASNHRASPRCQQHRPVAVQMSITDSTL
jgi:hypothetical protein